MPVVAVSGADRQAVEELARGEDVGSLNRAQVEQVAIA